MYEHVKRKLKSTNSNKQIQEFKQTNPGIQTNKSTNSNKKIQEFFCLLEYKDTKKGNFKINSC